jgi:protoporphyrinogen oxidase
MYDCIITGGGISGVSFGYYLCKAGKKVLLIDDKKKAGGQIITEKSALSPDYWSELGAHTCYNSYTNLISIINETGLKENVQTLLKYGYVVYSSEQIKSISSQLSVLSMIPSCFRYFGSAKEDKTVKEYFCPITGRKNYDHLFKHAFKAVICQPADNYPAEIFLKKRSSRDKTFPRKFSFKEGLSLIINSLLNNYNIEKHQSSVVEKIRKEGKIFMVETNDGQIFQSRNICLAAGSQTTGLLLKELEPIVSKLISSISVYESESINITVHKEKLKLKETAGVISLSNSFLSAVSRDLVADEKLRSFTFHFEKGGLNIGEKIDLICKVLDISQDDIIEQTFAEHKLPAMRLRHVDMEGQVRELTRDSSIYITGNYFYGLSIEDCVSRSKYEAGRFLEFNK